MDDVVDSVMIALLPTTDDWCHIDLPHMTLVYGGEIAELSPSLFNTMAKTASSISMVTPRLRLKVTGVDEFGEEDPVDVFTLEVTPVLSALRSLVDQWNKSQYTTFRPHCTIGPAVPDKPTPPMYLTFDRILVAWGTEHVTFWLNQAS